MSLADQRVERRDARARREGRGEQRQRRTALLLPPCPDHAVGRARPDDRRVRRQVGDRLGEVVAAVAVLLGAEQGDEVGRLLEPGAARLPRLAQRRGRVAELREGRAGAHPARSDGLCLPEPTITILPLAISTSRVRPAWSVRPRWIET